MAAEANEIEDRGPFTLAVTVAMLVCSTVFVSLRLISRALIVRKVSWDDYFMLAAWVIALGMSIAICRGTSVGLGRHERDVPDSWDGTLRRTEYAFSVLYNPALMATKTSILVFYLSLSRSRKIFRWAVLATLAVVNVGGLALTLLNVCQCSPISAGFKNPVPTTAKCTDILTLYLSSAPLNIITDFAILVLPMPILTGMRLPRKQKIILVITFSFGVFVAVVDVIRIAYLQSAATSRLQRIQAHQDTNATDTRNAETTDFSWYASFTFMWSAVEVHVGMMCACVPALKPLASRFLPKVLRDHSDDRTRGFGSSDAAAAPSADFFNGSRLPSVPERDDMTPPVSPMSTPPSARPLAGDGQMGMMEFLTTPDQGAPCERTNTAMTNTTRNTRPPVPTFFDFVNMKRRKSMVQMTNEESYFPFAMVTILFFVWGAAYGFLDVLNARFQQAANMTTAQSIGIHSAYFGAYLVGPLTFGRLVLKNWGFKACYMVGLVIYACGTLVFWPSAVLSSFPAFLVSNFIVGLGLSTLEIAANPFIALCGPPQYAEVRLNLSQGIQAIGTVASPLLAQKVLFKVDASSLIDVQWTYLGISLFTVFLALGYYYVPLPEASDEDLADACERMDDANSAELRIPISKSSHYSLPVIWVTLGLGVFSQFCYVGGQEAVSTSFALYLAEVNPGLNEVNHQAIGHAAFAVSRFLAAFFNFFIVLPRHLLLFSYAATIAFTVLAIFWHGTTPAVMIIMIYFFEGPIFSLIYAMCLRGMGRHTKDASTLLTAAISGGAVFPAVSFGARQGHGVQFSFCAIAAAFAAGSVFSIYTELCTKAKRIIDPIADPVLPDDEARSGQSQRQRVGSGDSWYMSIKAKVHEKLPIREHRERKSWASSQSNGKS